MSKFRKYLVAIVATLLAATASAADVPYGANLLQNTNPDGTTFSPWTKTKNGGDGWAISDGKFCSSYQECVLTQTVNLESLGLTTEQTNGLIMQAMVRYVIPWPGNYSGIAKVCITCKNAGGETLGSVQTLLDTTGTQIEVPETNVYKTFLLPNGTTQLVYEMHGESQVFWDGQYGPRFWGMYIGFSDLTKTTYTASVVAALGDSLVLSKTEGIKALDTITVTSKYQDVRVKSISSENSYVISSNQVVCTGADMTINAEFYRKHSIVASSEYGTITFKKDTAFCGDTIIVSHTLNSDSVAFAGYTSTPTLTWLTDSSFIMPNEDVTVGMEVLKVNVIPFRDGFENGNTQYQNIVGWVQQSEEGGDSWTANSTNTDHNCTPYSGSWNATLIYDNTDWLFTPVRLEKGERYVFSIYARQNESDVTYATITAKIGTAADKDSMKQVVLAETGVTNGDYQHLFGSFTADTSGVCWLGIRGYNCCSWLLSIDSVCLEKPKAYQITVDNKYGTINVKGNSVMFGDTITVSHTMNSDSVAFAGYTSTPTLTWLTDSTFIMPNEDVTIGMEVMKVNGIPFFDGFENGNTQGQHVAGWLQQSENGILSWSANSTFTSCNRTPYSGSWNATLIYDNTDWLFTPVRLEKGVRYVFSIYARQNVSRTAYATITAKIGTAADKDSMKQVVLAETGVTNGDYQHLFSSFTADTSGVCWLGIRGYIDNSSMYLSIDSVSLVREGWHAITAKSEYGTKDVKQGAMYGDTVSIRNIMKPGYAFSNYSIAPEVEWTSDSSSFIMPDCDVVITMTATKIDYNITLVESENGTLTATDTAQVDDTVKLTVSPAIGYTLDEISILQNSNTVVFNADDSTFVMPAGNVEIAAKFKMIDYAVIVNKSDSGTVTAPATAHMGGTVKLVITPNPSFVLDSVTISQGETQVHFNAEDSTFIMPVGDVKVDVTFNKIYTINIVESENGTVASSKATAQVDETVKLTITPDLGYTVDEISILRNDGTAVFNAQDSSFVMPADSVKITTTFKKIDYTITLVENENGTVTVTAATAQVGDTVKLTITPNSDFVLDKLVITQGETQIDFNAKDSTFIMPAGDVTISATFKQSTGVEDVKVLNLYVADGRIYCEGDFRIYDLLGRDVTAMNGSLRGVYIVRTKEAFKKLIVR